MWLVMLGTDMTPRSDTYLGHDMTPRSDNFMLEGLCSIMIFILEEERCFNAIR